MMYAQRLKKNIYPYKNLKLNLSEKIFTKVQLLRKFDIVLLFL